MLALVFDPAAPAFLALRDVSEPEPRADEALVAVGAVSLNRGEVMALRTNAGWFAPGCAPGWDVAGVVVRAAADGSGPPAGARVVGLMPVGGGGWAQLAAVRGCLLAELPDGVTLETAATLPVAGLTALATLALGSRLLERRVAITGAAGGVGRLAVQLARRAGAHVTAVVGSAERGEGLVALGAHEVTVGFDEDGEPFDLILESAGGELLSAAIRRVAGEGVLVCYGNSSHEPAVLDADPFHTRQAGASIHGFMIFEEVRRGRVGGRDLSALVSLLATGALDPQVDLVASWRAFEPAFDALADRQVLGKAVLTID